MQIPATRSESGAEVSADIETLKRDGVPRFVVYCLGVKREHVHMMRNAYRHQHSRSAPLLEKAVGDYNVKVIGFYSSNYFRLVSELSVTPHVLVLGPDFQAPYTREFKAWVRSKTPSVLRLLPKKIPVTALPNHDYYLNVYSVLALGDVGNSDVVSSEFDYGALIHLNYKRYVNFSDDDVLAPNDGKLLLNVFAGMDFDSSFSMAHA